MKKRLRMITILFFGKGEGYLPFDGRRFLPLNNIIMYSTDWLELVRAVYAHQEININHRVMNDVY